MKLKIVFIGKSKFNFIEDGIQEYLPRLSKYIKTELVYLKDYTSQRNEAIDYIKQKEGEELLKKVDQKDYLVLLDEKGLEFSSVNFSKHFEKLMNKSISGDLVLVIGGAYGFSEEIYKRANEKWSLSKMTFSHQLIRLVLLEQVFRAFTIIKGEKYHHEG